MILEKVIERKGCEGREGKRGTTLVILSINAAITFAYGLGSIFFASFAVQELDLD